MQRLTKAAQERVFARVRRDGCVIMSDFDGTLAPIASRPERVHISARAKRALVLLVKHAPVVVISGRAIADVKRRIGVSGLWYAGNHGLEWQFGRTRGRIRASRSYVRTLTATKRAIRALGKKYPGLLLEDKRLSVTIHFRGVASARRAACRQAIRAVLKQLSGRGMAFREESKLAFNVRPLAGYDKGSIAREALKKIPSDMLPIFIGDDETDEDAFRALRRGITIRVGYKKGSAARYWMRTRADVDVFLARLAGALATTRYE